MNLNDLTPEMRKRGRACKSADELVALATELGVTLTDEQLDEIAGGSWTHTYSTWVGIQDANPEHLRAKATPQAVQDRNRQLAV